MTAFFRRPAPDDPGPASDLTLEVEFCASGPAEFLIDAASAWGDDGGGWDGTCTMVSATIGGRARSREWLAEAFGADAVSDWEDRAFTAWAEALE